ncbi:MAG: [protein-PII] uridylyltransferase [Gammaproteobacteria bacterium]|nr:[protein-PII] uridylyltransferase [Gammaproteobacteria bacterium]MDH5776874.1 [protein-PII] uridylyltransferase [Gammaproteobacteria bacterium]
MIIDSAVQATLQFDADSFDNSLDTGSPPLPHFKKTIKEHADFLDARFWDNISVNDLVQARANFMDEILKRAWFLFIPEDNHDIALLAVGGYGRGELHPKSDIDLMILLEKSTSDYDQQLEEFLRFLWDIGLEVGHSVRTLDECVTEAENDITVATNIQEARLLVGKESLFQEQRQRCSPEQVWPSKNFFEAKWAEQLARHEKFNDTANNLEPNIKEGPGGLRDIQMIGWVAKRHFDANTLHDLVEHHFLTEQEYQTLIEGQSFLWKVRYGLHLLSSRREDRLLFDYQRTLAEKFGYQDKDHRLAVEHFMKLYYRTVMELSRLNEMLLQLFQEEILFSDETSEPEIINRRFQTRKGFLEVRDNNTFKHYPFALLELFLILQQNAEIKGVRANTIRSIRDHRHLIGKEFRNDLRCKSLFMEILRQPTGVTHELRRMNRYGILAAYLPVFETIVGQMQHDLFHVYTVDEHTLFVIRNLRRFTVPEFADEFPLCSELIQRIPKQELLVVAALFHDIAKGRGGDHSTLGAIDAAEFCKQHDFSKYDTDVVCWLIENHLIMSSTAQRKDISDPGVVHRFANEVGDINHLNYIYLLTVADIRATSPDVWNTWKDALLKKLYTTTEHALSRGLDNPLMQTDFIQDIKKQAKHWLNNEDYSLEEVQALWARWDDEYFLRYTVDEICWHTQSLLNEKANPPLVLVRESEYRGGTEIFIYSLIHDDLFAMSTAVIDQMALNVVEARIMNSKDGYSLNTYLVLDQKGKAIKDPYQLEILAENIQAHLENKKQTTQVVRHINRKQKHFTFPTEVEFWADPNKARTVMQVTAFDRPGMLSLIGTSLNQCNVRLHSAKISTFGERAEDLFFITGEDDKPLKDMDIYNCLHDTITEFLDE